MALRGDCGNDSPATMLETCRELGWERLANGELLDRAEDSGFEVMITTDQGIRYQQNMSGRRISVVVLMTYSAASRPSMRSLWAVR